MADGVCVGGGGEREEGMIRDSNRCREEGEDRKI